MLRAPRVTTRPAAVCIFFCSITDRDCVAHRPSTSRLYFDVGVDFTGLFFLSDPAAWRDGRHPRGRSLRRRLHRRLVRTSTFAGSSSPSPIGTPSPTLPTVVSPHATRSDQPMCVIHPASVTFVLVERALHRARRAVAACNTRFIKEHKPSNHIRARIKSHVYTTE